MTASVLKQDPNTKGSYERLFILTRTHSMHIFGERGFPRRKKCILCVRVKINKRSFEPFRVHSYGENITARHDSSHKDIWSVP